MAGATITANVYHKGYLSTELAALTGAAEGHIVTITGHTTAGDGGGGIARWDASDTSTADDGATVWGAGSTGRWKRVYSGPLDVRWFGAVGDGVASDSAAVLATIAAVNTGAGGKVVVPAGTYATSAALALTSPVSLAGEAGTLSTVNPSGAADAANTISVTPDASRDHTLQCIQGLALQDPTNGRRQGQHGIYLSTPDASQNLPKLTIRDLAIGKSWQSGAQGTGWGIYHDNDVTDNVNGALYAAVFENLQVKDGIRLVNTGDSNNILHCLLSNENIGVHITTAPGASNTQIVGNNITCDGGAIRLDSGHRPWVTCNNIENYIAAGALAQNDGAVINLTGDTQAIVAGVIAGNRVSGYGSSDATMCLRLANCRGTIVDGNVFLSGGGGAGPSTAITIEATCTDVRIGPNTANVALSPSNVMAVTDNGVGTMGVLKEGVLQNSWVVRSASHKAFDYIKSADGMVHVAGSIKSGTTTDGTQIMAMPVGFRPRTIVRVPCIFEDTGAVKIGEITVETGGEVRINWITASTNLSFNFSYAALNLGHSVCTE